MVKKLAFTLTLAVALVAGSAFAVQVADGGGKEKGKKECASKKGCCAHKANDASGTAVGTGSDAKAACTGEKKKGCCAKKGTE